MRFLLAWFLAGFLEVLSTRAEQPRWRAGHSYPGPLPQEIMVDAVNYIGLLLLHAHNQNNDNNIALSPYGATSVLVALGEGVQGAALDEILRATLLPLDVSVTRVGLRDIHRHLKSYFIPQEGFLAGLTFSHENVTLKPSYEDILKFYGYDVESFNNALYPDPYSTTPASSQSSTELSANFSSSTTQTTPITTTIPTTLDNRDQFSTDSTTVQTTQVSTNPTTLTSEEESTITSPVVTTRPATTTQASTITTSPSLATEAPTSPITTIATSETTVSSTVTTTTPTTTAAVTTQPTSTISTTTEEITTTARTTTTSATTPTTTTTTTTTQATTTVATTAEAATVATTAQATTVSSTTTLGTTTSTPSDTTITTNQDTTIISTTPRSTTTFPTTSSTDTMTTASPLTSTVTPTTLLIPLTSTITPTTLPTTASTNAAGTTTPLTSTPSTRPTSVTISVIPSTLGTGIMDSTTTSTTTTTPTQVQGTGPLTINLQPTTVASTSTDSTATSSTAATETTSVVTAAATAATSTVTTAASTTTIPTETNTADTIVPSTTTVGPITLNSDASTITTPTETSAAETIVPSTTTVGPTTLNSDVSTITTPTETSTADTIVPSAATVGPTTLNSNGEPTPLTIDLVPSTVGTGSTVDAPSSTENSVPTVINPSDDLSTGLEINVRPSTIAPRRANLTESTESERTQRMVATTKAPERKSLPRFRDDTELIKALESENISAAMQNLKERSLVSEQSSSKNTLSGFRDTTAFKNMKDLVIDASIGNVTNSVTLKPTGEGDSTSTYGASIDYLDYSDSNTFTYENKHNSDVITQTDSTTSETELALDDEDIIIVNREADFVPSGESEGDGLSGEEMFSEPATFDESSIFTESNYEEGKTRGTRSVIDYLIARYHDNNPHQAHASAGHVSAGYEPAKPTTFAVNGKIRETNISFMTYDTVLPFRYISYLNALALTFPLDSTKYYLLLILPVDDMGIDNLISNMMSTTLKQIIYHLQPTRVKATIPSFMLKGYVVLTPTLQKLGIRQIFEPRHADFSRMTDDKDIYVTNIEQAVTVTIRNYVDPSTLQNNHHFRRRGPVQFTADHPFLYFVMDSQIHVALMAGKIINPLNSRIR